MDLRTALAAVLGVGFGLALLAYPEAVVSAQTAGRLPRDRGGEYGAGTEPSGRVRRLVQAVGLVALLAGLYFAWTLL
ncbi:MAG: hypothetical protein ABEJ22_09490 [Haloferacaceae archaeon]